MKTISEVEKTATALRNEYFAKYPKDAAYTLESVARDAVLNYLKEVNPENAKAVFIRLNPETAADLITKMQEPLFISLFSQVDTHLAARLLSRLDTEDVDKKLSLLPSVTAREIRDFLNFRPGTAGYLMETNVATFYNDNLVEDVLNKIRKLKDRRIAVVYVLDEEGRLSGKIPVQHIAISQPSETLHQLIEPAPSINAMASREEVLKLIENEDLLQIPVIDINNKLLGVIRNDALMSAAKKE